MSEKIVNKKAITPPLASMLSPKAWDMVLSLDEDLNATKKLHVFWQIVKGFVGTISTQDPSKIHQLTARLALKKSNVEEKIQAVDQLARELTNCCNTLNIKLANPPRFEALLNIYEKNTPAEEWKKNGLSPTVTLETHPDWLESLFEKDGLFLGDYILLEVIEKIGEEGKKAASELKPDLKENLKRFKQRKETNLLKHWINTKKSSKPISKVLELLADIILEDKVKKNINFGEKNVAALTRTVHRPIIQITSQKKSIIEAKNKEKTHLYLSNECFASIAFPLSSIKILKQIKKGIVQLSCLTSHRLLNYLIQTTFDLFTSGDQEFRILRFDGGYKELASKLKLTSKKETEKLKNILTTLNYLTFETKEIQSRIINIAQYKSKKSNRYDGLEITVLSPLLPHRIFEDGGLLVVLFKEPNFIGRLNDRAKQLLLQLMIAELFTQHSINLANNEYIEITDEKWLQLAGDCKITKNFLQKIKKHWTQGQKSFLKKIEKRFYTLGNPYKKELQFLVDQGHRRIQQSLRGKASAKKRSVKPFK